jgi:hypothetical protein
MTKNKEQTPHGFCETPEQKCTMNYCDENGCQNRKRTLTEPIEMTDNKEQTAVQLIIQALDIECKSRGMNVNWDMYLEKEREQIEYSFENGFDISYLEIPDDSSIDTSLEAKRFYNKTYGGNK